MSDLLSTIESEYFACCRKAEELLNQLDSSVKKDELLQEITQQIHEADLCVKQMEIEIEGSNIMYKQELKQKMRTQKQSLEQLKKRNRKTCSEYSDMKNKENLYMGMSEAQRKELVQQDEREVKLMKQNLKLQDAKMTGYSIEKEASNIQLELHRHSDLLNNDIEKTRMTNGELSESNVLLKRMQDRIKQNKMVLYVVMGIVTLASAIIVYTKI